MNKTAASTACEGARGALIKALHPDWLPSEIKSALMTTTRDTVSSEADPFAQGGLVGVTPIADSVTTGAYDIDNPVVDSDTDVYHVTVAAGTRAARFSLDSADDTADLDLFVYLKGELVDLSASSSADEEVTLRDPAEGTYDVYVNGFATPGGSTSYGISNFVVPNAAAGNATVTPNPVAVTGGTPVTLTASWSGLDPAKRWFGVIARASSTAIARPAPRVGRRRARRRGSRSPRRRYRATRVGYRTPSAFVAAFRAHTGLTPGRYFEHRRSAQARV